MFVRARACVCACACVCQHLTTQTIRVRQRLTTQTARVGQRLTTQAVRVGQRLTTQTARVGQHLTTQTARVGPCLATQTARMGCTARHMSSCSIIARSFRFIYQPQQFSSPTQNGTSKKRASHLKCTLGKVDVHRKTSRKLKTDNGESGNQACTNFNPKLQLLLKMKETLSTHTMKCNLP